jgi:hypothetical protein
MKVETDLKSGAFLQDAVNAVDQAAGQVGSFFSQASQEASNLTSTVMDKTSSVYNCLAGK